ncbi:MAG: amino acid adenylation domain-containing protein [Oscillatoriophycideae cyanobacterium NC_groundwater_1537_Pr4_S-0.65um_50_18]|nr:amino acid adenylation domain-containing protein [Oscillatoriophycideae cyanobacterium NC_groundwater_1537_Pr4_S-0.65um_50_18]
MTSTVNLTAFENDRPSDDVFCFPASFAQQRLWFLHQLAPENPFYDVTAAIRLTGKLHIDRLEQTFNAIVQRHEALRTTFTRIDGELMQVITPHLHMPLPVITLHTVPPDQRDELAQRQAIAAFQQPFNLSDGPLMRVTLLQFDETEHVLLLNLHHIVSDGWSIGVLIQELGALYAAFVENTPSPLVELPIQYADFAHWQREYLQGEVLETQLAYWQQQLLDLPTLTLPTDLPRPAVQSYRGGRQQLVLSPALTAALEALSQQTGATLFMTLLAAFQTLLYRYTGQADLAVGSPIANRNRSELEGLIGFFVNSLVLRTNLAGNPTFRTLLRQVQATTLAAYAHQDLPFEKLVEALQPTRDFSRNPLFQVVFALQNAPIAPLQLPGLTLSPLDFDSGTTRFDLECHCFKALDTLHCTVIYSTDLFESATINRMLQQFQVLLEGIVAHPDQSIAHLPLLTPAESHQRLITWNDTALDYAETCIHHHVEAQATQTPDAIAVVFANQSLTYQELNQRANQLAHHLQQLGVCPETVVGLCVDRSPNLIIGVLGIWKAGGAYLPLDPGYPSDRLNFMLKDTQVDLVVTQQAYGDQFSDRLQVVYLDQDGTDPYTPANPTSHVTANHLAYVIYTSGSTGKPKGVLVEHRGLSNLIAAQRQVFNLQPTHRILQFASLNFDAFIFEWVMALANGASLYMAPKETLLPGATLLQFLQDNAITHVTLPPAVLALLPSDALPALQTIIAAGEACSSTVVDRWAKDHQFFNAYGPTEATIWATVAQLQLGDSPTIGRPIANTQIYLLDAHLQPVPVGVTGELYIGGAGVARGYLNRPDLTAERFTSNPYNPASRLYKTGDLARYRADGSLDYLGRVDRQIKLNGYRIELGEIETILHQHSAIQIAVVTLQEDNLRAKRLVAYLLLQPEQTIATDDLRHFLRSQLPNHLIPSTFVQLETLPLTSNGKIDNAALPNANKSNVERISFVAPRTAIEETIASLWEQLLQQESIGIHDSFFDLGGNSLLAVHLMDQMAQQFEQELPLSSLLLNPTIAGLASVLNQTNQPLPWSPLVPLQPKGSKPPFFCVHPIFGTVLPYYLLAQQMGLDQPFYGLQPLGIGGKPPHTRIEEMAAYYIQAIRQVQPQGPYYLGGWSFGGLVAFEMAQQLRQAGHKVALLAVLDTLAPIPANKPSFWKGFKFLLTTAMRSVWVFLLDYLSLIATSDRFKSLRQTNLPKTWRGSLERAAITSLLPQEAQARVLNELTIRPMLQVFYANSQAVHRYVPQTYCDRITLFRTPAPSEGVPDLTLGWQQLSESKVEIHQIPGNHFTMLRNPQVERLAQQLQECIEQSL